MYAKSIFTEHERLFNTVTNERLKEFLDKYPIIGADVDENSYGEFLFITFELPSSDHNSIFTFWSLGVHEYRQQIFDESCWRVHSGIRTSRCVPSGERIPKDKVIKLIQSRKKYLKKLVVRPDRESEIFRALADMSDDDYALSNIF